MNSQVCESKLSPFSAIFSIAHVKHGSWRLSTFRASVLVQDDFADFLCLEPHDLSSASFLLVLTINLAIIRYLSMDRRTVLNLRCFYVLVHACR